jgi:GTP-binding protein
LVAVNKSEAARFRTGGGISRAGLGAPLAISAAHGEACDLSRWRSRAFRQRRNRRPPTPTCRRCDRRTPNVGKSTLVNAILGEERVIAFDQPGTTRDSIYIDFERGGRPYTLIDTAGLRRRGKIDETAEKFSVIKTLQAIEDANVVILLLDARQDIADQDAHVAGFILEAGKALVVAVNKWEVWKKTRASR